MKTLAIVNQKGGVGKSFVATQLSFYLASRGQRVLVVDLDHQGNTSVPLLKSKRSVSALFSAADILNGQAKPLETASVLVVKGDGGLCHLERQPESTLR